MDFTASACTSVLNATDSSDIFTPATDGDSIVTLDSASTNRYVAVQFEGSNSGEFSSSNDLKIGCILIGSKFDIA